MNKKQTYRGGFALPTVLIASVVMLIVLSVSVSSVAAIRTTLKTQYYEQLAKAAGEAGVAYAKACLAKNGNKPLWTDAKPLRPSTDCAGNPLLNPEVQVLVVAGGGGGGNNHGGGGGGGGVVANNAFTVSGGQSYAVSVGGGGAGGASGGAAGTRGGNSSFAGGLITAQGGGGGGGRLATNSVSQASSGGSGGGGAGTLDGATSLPGAGASGTSGQGFAGGNGSSGATAGNGGGGGGAGEAGTAASGTAASAGTSGDGGAGYFSDISGAIFYYGGGGSGGRWAAGSYGLPGVSGGGRGGENDGTVGRAGQANTGGGGGGGGGATANGGNGGSGVVYVRYANNGTITASGGSVTPYVSGPYKIHAFKNTGASTFTVSSATSSVCPSDPRCSVVVNDTLRSSFSVPRPSLDAEGKALTIANTGYVELLRTSTGAVWRTYRQPAVQVAAVPDLCSGSATSALGWQSAVVASNQEALPNASSAKTIALSNGALPAGKMYFRKDFTVLEAGAYNFSLLSTDTNDVAQSYIDGAVAITSVGGVANATTNLSVGCHTITVQLTNKSVASSPARFTAALGRSGSAPIVSTDTSWRVSSGNSVHFSQSDFYADPSMWGRVVNYGTTGAQAAVANWGTTSGDPFTQMIAPPGNGCPSGCPYDSSGYMRDSQDIYVASPTPVTVTTLCDNDCAVYMDGQVVLGSSPWATTTQQSFTITPGYHRFGIRLYNGAAVVNPGGAGMSVVASDGTVLTRTDLSWQGATQWTAGLNATSANIQSYENSFTPSPNEIPTATTFDFLAIGGGGGGGANSAGGGGAGGLIAMYDAPAIVGSYPITIGAGGAGAVNHTVNGAKGANTAFGSYVALGGGYGASRDGGLAATSGGSGGGGAGATVALRVPGGAGTSNQGSAGGAGVTADAGGNATGGGGGGAGGPGLAGISGGAAGNGGPGYITYMTGSRLAIGGGGGGSVTVAGSMGNSTDGGGVGTTMALLNGVANTGGGGGGRTGAAAGGNGGSGLVVVRVKTGSMNVSVTGSPATSSVTIQGVSYTIYRFTSNGSFIINSLN